MSTRFQVQHEVEYEVERETQHSQQEKRLRQERIRQEEQLRQQLAEQRRLEEECRLKLKAYKDAVNASLEETLAGSGYYPPEPSAFLMNRTLKALMKDAQERMSDPVFAQALSEVEREIEARCHLAHGYFEELRAGFAPPNSLSQMLKVVALGVHKSIYEASVSIEMPQVNSELAAKMSDNEVFLAKDWVEGEHRGVLAVHVDEETQTTILQIGIAEYGPIYVTIPAILRPEDRALKSIKETINRLASFRNGVDPLAVIDGSHQALNYNEIFVKSRVVRAPSGNTNRLATNMRESAQRSRLSTDNTVILNSSPRNQEQYHRIFREDQNARHWPAWGNEAELWDGAVESNGFAMTQEASQEALVRALSQSKNVIVVLAHSDGEDIFMPEPPPTGSRVSADYLREHQAEIEANAPFVYLFSCQAGRLSNLRNFASTLIDCGASGVIASQSDLGSAEGRRLLGRILGEGRGTPPIEDYFRAMDELSFREMEVFLG